ncbi:MAG: FAD-dependent oxidoreductase, partial [Myxococcales bacterium]|nr:FAD-dependent oxidoreductase [Myxococcales bacterium]
MSYRRDELRFNGWGLRRKTFDLRGRDDEVWAFVREALGMASLPSTPPTALEDIALPEVRLSDEVLAGLRSITADERVCTDAYERAFHAVGKSYYDMVRIRAGEVPDAPDAVVYPLSHEEVVAILAACAEAKVAVVPFGGGSSVVGGVEARRGDGHAGLVTLDTTRMDRLIEIDETSHTATFQAGIYGPALEEKLAARGYTLGHFPQSFEF